MPKREITTDQAAGVILWAWDACEDAFVGDAAVLLRVVTNTGHAHGLMDGGTCSTVRALALIAKARAAGLLPPEDGKTAAPAGESISDRLEALERRVYAALESIRAPAPRLTEKTKESIRGAAATLCGSGVPKQAMARMLADHAIGLLENQRPEWFTDDATKEPPAPG